MRAISPGRRPPIVSQRTMTSALDVMNSEGVQALGNAELVRNRKVDPFTLAAVAQGRIVNFHVRFHASVSPAASSQHRPQRNRISTLPPTACKVQIGPDASS